MSLPSCRRLSVLVYPHSSEIGGSQLNAVDLAAAVRDLGHEVVVYAEDGPLLARVEQLRLPHVRSHPAPRRPSPLRARHLASVADWHGVDVVHGYEWPPILEAWAASGRSPHRRPVGTVLSMGVAPFVPAGLPLVVGTARIGAGLRRRGPVHVMEPPVDTVENVPGAGGAAFAARHPAPEEALRVVVVSRLARELKLEGILTAVRTVRALAASMPVHLTVVGDGPAAAEVKAAAEAANAGSPVPLVTLTGELADPRGAYDCADVVLGMGGSALRALCFAKPLVVQGEGGFFEVLDEASLPLFLEQGFFGLGSRTAEEASDHLAGLLRGLAADGTRRARLGGWGRRLAEGRFSLSAAAVRQERVYRTALTEPVGAVGWGLDSARSAAGLVSYKAGRRWTGLRGEVPRDDFNAIRA